MDGTDWKSTHIYMLDFEGSPASGVVEYGVVHLIGGQINATETSLCRPTGSIHSRDREVHGIGETEAMAHELFSSHYAHFVELRRKGIFAAHNRHAENSFIKNTWAVPPVVPDWRAGFGTSQEWGPWVDTLSLYKSIFPGLDSYGLGDLVKTFGLQQQLEAAANEYCPQKRRKPHCALYDAIASSLLLTYLESLDEMCDRMSIRWLLQLSQGIEPQQELF
ncbi:MAG: 3'-5' exonuclease [Puniceicoccaceae bacterium]